MEPGSTGLLIFALILVVLSAFFAMSETSLTSISKLTIRHMVESGVKRAKVVEKIVNDRERLISSVLIGANLTTIIVTSIATTIAINISGEENEALAVTIAAVITTVVILIFGDIIPKVMASKNSEKIALFVARPMVFVMFILSPISKVLNGAINKIFSLFGAGKDKDEGTLTEQEVLTMLDMGYQAGVIPEEESQMIGAVFGFRKTQARDIMIPRTDMVAISDDAGYDEIIEVFKEEQFSRLPVFRDNLDDVIGVLNFKDFMLQDIDEEDFEAKLYMREPFFTYELQSTKKLFANMREAGATLAIVLDEYGGCAGLVTIEDLVEKIMGEIFDEHDDVDDEITCITAGEEYVADGSARIEDFNKLLDMHLVSEDYDTLAGYATGLFGYIPKQGEEITYENLSFIVETVGKNRIESLRIKIKSEETAGV